MKEIFATGDTIKHKRHNREDCLIDVSGERYFICHVGKDNSLCIVNNERALRSVANTLRVAKVHYINSPRDFICCRTLLTERA